jgi:hypothetical protein
MSIINVISYLHRVILSLHGHSKSHLQLHTRLYIIDIAYGASLPNNTKFYVPQTASIAAGTKVVWTNSDNSQSKCFLYIF